MITHAAVLWLRRVLWRPLWCKSTGIAFGAPPVESDLCLHFSPAPCFGAQDAPGHAHAAFTRYVLDRWMVSACHECVRLGGASKHRWAQPSKHLQQHPCLRRVEVPAGFKFKGKACPRKCYGSWSPCCSFAFLLCFCCHCFRAAVRCC